MAGRASREAQVRRRHCRTDTDAPWSAPAPLATLVRDLRSVRDRFRSRPVANADLGNLSRAHPGGRPVPSRHVPRRPLCAPGRGHLGYRRDGAERRVRAQAGGFRTGRDPCPWAARPRRRCRGNSATARRYLAEPLRRGWRPEECSPCAPTVRRRGVTARRCGATGTSTARRQRARCCGPPRCSSSVRCAPQT